ncbi:glycoside hydrolase family 36 protein [Lachnoclostridium sp. Marseille-P6806]|uniref:glycoside hydrolase family 36 protein n=1 Tax=Lachnoclostridium sp. Marseille-P6806 TaxID=2364793 RepID=UPI0010302711|nr:glycoside hydrolase family 36 protein [Lachnoclostridium sp. Marseille-P6806]
MSQKIEMLEKNLYVAFNIRDDGVVELEKFVPSSLRNAGEVKIGNGSGREMGQVIYPIIEINVTGKSTRGTHGYRHNSGSASLDFKYVNHVVNEHAAGKKLVITLKTESDIYAYYHMTFYDDIPVVRVFTELENKGTESWPVEYISSFIYQNVCGNGKQPYFDKTDIYIPYNSWDCEAHWKKEDLTDLNLSGMVVDGFNTPGFGNNRFAYTGHSSWSSVEYLPMGICQDREMKETYIFQVESSGQWHIEYDTELGKRLAIALSGPTEQEHAWWLNLKPGIKFTTVPAAFGVVEGDVSDSVAALTLYRRAMRRPNDDDEKLNVVFNDYMNCLMGDPTDEKERAIMDKAAAMGCEYYCLDCGWYDKGYWWDRVGEWVESPERFPNGLKAICDYANGKGMKMGLWLEIEVMGTASELAAKLPDDWFVCRHGKRHIDNKRYLLDFRNPEVYQYCMDVVDRLINDYGVGYFKIDYNVTQGIGSDLNTESCAGAVLGHYEALHRWYEEIFRKHPDLVIENCGSGAQRMDYGMLRLLSLQSTSDQTDYIYNSYIASNVASAVTPEQAGMWVYPYENEEEHVIYNMINGILLRPYMSGMVWKFGEHTMDLLREGISVYKRIRGDIRKAVPFWPVGFNNIRDSVLVYGVKTEDVAYLSVFTPKTDTAEIPLHFDGKIIDKVEVIYPSRVNCEFELKDGVLSVKMPQMTAARLFRVTLK